MDPWCAARTCSTGTTPCLAILRPSSSPSALRTQERSRASGIPARTRCLFSLPAVARHTAPPRPCAPAPPRPRPLRSLKLCNARAKSATARAATIGSKVACHPLVHAPRLNAHHPQHPSRRYARVPVSSPRRWSNASGTKLHNSERAARAPRRANMLRIPLAASPILIWQQWCAPRARPSLTSSISAALTRRIRWRSASEQRRTAASFRLPQPHLTPPSSQPRDAGHESVAPARATSPRLSALRVKLAGARPAHAARPTPGRSPPGAARARALVPSPSSVKLAPAPWTLLDAHADAWSRRFVPPAREPP